MALPFRKSPQRTVSPAREALAAEIGRQAELTARLNEIRSAGLDDAVAAARKRFEMASGALEEARMQDAADTIGALRSGGPLVARATVAARAELADAEASVEVIRQVRSDMEAEARELGNHLRSAGQDRVERLVRAVLEAEAAPAVDQVMADIQALQAEMAKKESLLRVLVKAGAVPELIDRQRTPAGEMLAAVEQAQRWGDAALNSEAARWESAIRALHADATAELPQ